jgi:AcrR family transcriptional regulator
MAQSRDRLLASAEALVAEDGFAAASIARVAERAGVATGTVYRYFPSKADLLREVFREAAGREVAIMRQQIERDGSAMQRLAAAISTFARRAIRGRRMAYALIAEPIDPTIEAERLVYRRAYADVLAALVSSGIASGEFRPQDVSVCAASLVGALAEALVGPLSPLSESVAHVVDEGSLARSEALVHSMIEFCTGALRAP